MEIISVMGPFRKVDPLSLQDWSGDVLSCIFHDFSAVSMWALQHLTHHNIHLCLSVESNSPESCSQHGHVKTLWARCRNLEKSRSTQWRLCTAFLGDNSDCFGSHSGLHRTLLLVVGTRNAFLLKTTIRIGHGFLKVALKVLPTAHLLWLLPHSKPKLKFFTRIFPLNLFQKSNKAEKTSWPSCGVIKFCLLKPGLKTPLFSSSYYAKKELCNYCIMVVLHLHKAKYFIIVFCCKFLISSQLFQEMRKFLASETASSSWFFFFF